MIHALTVDRRGNRGKANFASEAELKNWQNTQRRTRSGLSIGAAMRDNYPSAEELGRRAIRNEVVIGATARGWGWRLHGEDSYHLCSSRGQTLRDAFDNGHLGE
jgi:hypothetical protein